MLADSLRKYIAISILLPTFLGGSFGWLKAKAESAALPVSEFIVKFKTSADAKLLANLDPGYQERFTKAKSPVFKNIYTFHCACEISELSFSLRGRYEFLEPVSWFETQAAMVVNDPGYTLNSADIDKQWALEKTGFPEAWNSVTGSRDNIVAVVDTGVDATHEDLRSITYVRGFNFFTRQDIVGNVNSDDNGHGTLVAGILGASVNNNIGIAGTNWQISLMPLKALDETGKGDAATIAEAIVWAADHGAKFVNLSIGGIGFAHDTVLANSITYAFNKGLVIVAAAGNDVATEGHSLDSEPVFPICDDNNQNMIIGVAAVDQNDVKPPFSNYGKNCIDVVAPGKRILSTINHDPISKKYAPNSYAYASGTSLAVPFVVGQAALIRAMFPNATNIQIRDKIITTADSVDGQNLAQCGGGSCRGLLGAGRINVLKSLSGSLFTDSLREGDLVKLGNSPLVYQISGGQRRPISPFVLNTRFVGSPVKTVGEQQLSSYPEGAYVTPADGALVKLASDAAVYFMSAGQKLPITYEVFMQRGFDFSQVHTVDFPEFNSWVTGSFLPPTEGSIVRGYKSPTVYWIVSGVLHPMSSAFYRDKGLDSFSIFRLPDKDMEKMPKGEPYVK